MVIFPDKFVVIHIHIIQMMAINVCVAELSTDLEWYPRQKVAYARKKLDGHNPAYITRYVYQGEGHNYYSKVKVITEGHNYSKVKFITKGHNYSKMKS